MPDPPISNATVAFEAIVTLNSSILNVFVATELAVTARIALSEPECSEDLEWVCVLVVES